MDSDGFAAVIRVFQSDSLKHDHSSLGFCCNHVVFSVNSSNKDLSVVHGQNYSSGCSVSGVDSVKGKFLLIVLDNQQKTKVSPGLRPAP